MLCFWHKWPEAEIADACRVRTATRCGGIIARLHTHGAPDTPMSNSIYRITAYLALLLVNSASFGQVPETLKECMSIDIAIERLTCFDREMSRLTTDVAESVAEPAAELAASTRTEPRSIAQPEPTPAVVDRQSDPAPSLAAHPPTSSAP